MARNMYKLSLFLYKDDWKELAESMLSRTKKIILTEPSYLSNWACLYADLTQPTAEIAISGRDSVAKRKAFDQIFLPNKIMAGMESNSSLPILEDRASKDDKTMIYVCYNKTCQRPVEEVSEAIKVLNS
jgi:hypothetical protein